MLIEPVILGRIMPENRLAAKLAKHLTQRREACFAPLRPCAFALNSSFLTNGCLIDRLTVIQYSHR